MNAAAWEAWGVWATFLATGGGLLLVRRQIQQTNRNIQTATSERLSAQSFEVIRLLAQFPESCRGFDQGQASPDYEGLLYAAEALTNYIENIVSQLKRMDKDLREP